MKKIDKHIKWIITGLGVFLLGNTGLYAQTDSSYKYIYIESPIFFSGTEIPSGDTIHIDWYVADTIFISAHMIYNANDSMHVVELPAFSNLPINEYYDTIKFTYYSQTQGCSTNLVETETVYANNNSSSIFISKMLFLPYELVYNSTNICLYEERVELNNTIPLDELYVYSLDSFLILDTNYAILPSQSMPGQYKLIVETDYCFSGLESINTVNIIGETAMFVPDTLSYCATGVNSFGQADGYVFTPLDFNNIGDSMEVTRSGNYLVALDGASGCASLDTVYVNIVKPTEISLQVDESNCKHAIVSLSAANLSTLENIDWQNGNSGTSIELFKSDYIHVSAIDEFGCYAKDSVYVEVIPLKVENFDYSQEEADCWKDGQLVVNQVATNYGASGLNYSLVNKLNNKVVNDLENIPDGLYKLELTNEDNCRAIAEEEITITQKCLEDYPVFSPNQDGQEDEYFIPYEGKVQVFDRNGAIVKELETPAYWDGTDSEGNPLSMGNYVIVTDSGRPVNITIVR